MFIRKRAGKLARLNAECKAYQTITSQAAEPYNGSHGFRDANGNWMTYVTSARLKSTGPLLREDATNETYVAEQESILPAFSKE